MRRLMKERPRFWKWHLKAAAAKRALTNVSQYTTEEKIVCLVMMGAKQRCTNPNSKAYKNYGGRGIEFRFAGIEVATRWVCDNLGLKPSKKYSIDRIDNNGHYERGNLRWATTVEQARNKRAYKNGTRMRRLRKFRPDYSKQGIHKFIGWGWTDEQILAHKKGSHVKTRHA